MYDINLVLLLLLNNSRLIEKISTKTLLKNVNMLSVNQTNAQIKITDVWKALHDPYHPLKIEKVVHDASSSMTRSVTNGDLKEFGKSEVLQSTFLSDASRIWNICPNNIKSCESIWQAKKAIRQFFETLPI